MTATHKSRDPRGRLAEHPKQIPKLGWRDILKRTFSGLSEENASIAAAGVAFYGFLSIPALLSAVLSIYGIAANPAQVQQQVSALRGVVPGDALSVISAQLTMITSQGRHALTLALIGSIIFALWSGSNSIRSLIDVLNIMYEEKEKRGIVKLYSESVLMTLVAVLIAVISVTLVVAASALGAMAIPQWVKNGIAIARWPVLAFIGLASLSSVYRYGPSRTEAQWRWVSWGAVAAMFLWLIASAFFSWYASRFGNYNKTYGSLAAVVVLLMWLYISAYAVIFGAKLNAEMEHQTAKDTTEGEPAPMGKRGAKMADTLGRAG